MTAQEADAGSLLAIILLITLAIGFTIGKFSRYYTKSVVKQKDQTINDLKLNVAFWKQMYKNSESNRKHRDGRAER
jgi:uncharacterized membrane protein